MNPDEARQAYASLRDAHLAASQRWAALVADPAAFLATPRFQVAWDELERTRRELMAFQLDHQHLLRDRREEPGAGPGGPRPYPPRHRGRVPD